MGQKGLLSTYIDGKKVSAPLNWQDISILATFEDDNVQANISTEEIEATGELSKAIINHVDGGLNGGVGIFEGLPIKLEVFNSSSSYIGFDGYADLTNEYEDGSKVDGRILFNIVKKNGLNSLSDKLEGLTYGYLESIGVFTSSDYTNVEYVIEKENNAVEIITLSITTFLMVKEFAESIRETSQAISDASAVLSAGITGSIGALIITVSRIALAIAYSATLLAALIKLMTELIQALIPPKRTSKCISLYSLLRNVFEYLGYVFESDISELNNYYFLPSNTNADEYVLGFIKKTKGTSSGIPNIADSGYLVSEMTEIVKNMFNGRYAVNGNKVIFRNYDSQFWVKQSSYKLPDVLQKRKKYNTSELNANRVLSFRTDVSDEWTTLNFKGTNFQIITDSVSSNDINAKFIKGLENIEIPFSLGTRKDKLNAIENGLKAVGSAVDKVTGVFGRGTRFASQVKGRVGLLKISNNNYNIPKILNLSATGKMPSNHRDRLSAKYLMQNFHFGKSFVQNDFFGQKIRYENVTVPFGFNDFLKTIENSYFYDSEGREAKIEKIEYNIFSDTANVDYWIREKYTVNLKETEIEP